MCEVDLSIVIPVYNEQENVGHLYRGIVEALDPKGWLFEVIFVDDGSSDLTFERIAGLAQQDRRVGVVKFRRNFGQTPATVAGIQQARGRAIVTMDGDLQNDPADIPRMVGQLNNGYDMVVGWRHQRQDAAMSRVIPSKIANWLISRVTKVAIRDTGCSLRVYRAELIKNIPLYAEMHRFVPAMTSLAGARIYQMKVNHRPRQFGVSKYGASRIYKVLIDLMVIRTLIVLTSRPPKVFAGVASLALTISLGFFLYYLVEFAFVNGGSSIVWIGISVLFGALGLFLLMLGLLAQLAYRTGSTKVEDLSVLTATLIRAEPTDVVEVGS